MACDYTSQPHKMYLIRLLAEHAEEENVNTEFLRWMKGLLEAPT
jgi:hypothetical protein